MSNPPEAIISGNDLTLMEILTFIFERGIKIGRDLGLVTIDEVSFGAIHTPPLTTIAQPTFDIGAKAANILLEKIQKKNSNKKPIVYRYAPQIIVRESGKREGERH